MKVFQIITLHSDRRLHNIFEFKTEGIPKTKAGYPTREFTKLLEESLDDAKKLNGFVELAGVEY